MLYWKLNLLFHIDPLIFNEKKYVRYIFQD